MQHFELDRTVAESCLNASLEDGTANISLRAAKFMLEKMQGGIVDCETGQLSLPLQNEAASAVAQEVAKLIDPMRARGDDGGYKTLDKLPYYGEAVRDGRHIIPGTGCQEDDDKTRWGGVTNPTVHIALNQIRLVVNELIERFGHPQSIAIELGREFPLGAEKRREIEKEQSANQKKNEELDNTLRKYKQKENAGNRLKLFLWQQLDEGPTGRCCPFSGDSIGICDLFSGNIEVEHLIPFSRSLDDSRANKVVCTRQANREKGNQTPHEAFGHSPDGYDWQQIFARAESLPDSKRWRFKPEAMEIWNREEGGDFTSRHLNDTRYIGRLAREYLENICDIDRIDVVTGRLTSLLRRHWGLNSVLDDRTDRKNRDDHRHHAVDAIVVAMTNRSLLQKMAKKARELEKIDQDPARNLDRYFPPVDGKKSAIDPWESFRSDVADVVERMVVSHKRCRKELRGESTDGQLHNDTAYGIVRELKGDKYEVVSRKPVNKFKNLKTIEAIVDERLRGKFMSAFEIAEENEEGAVEELVKKLGVYLKIKRLRCMETLSVSPISGQDSENPYNSYKGESKWGVEIYSLPSGHKNAGDWKAVTISRFDANKKDFKPGETFRPHPAARLIMRLQINDCVEMLDPKTREERKLYRLQLASSSMIFAEIHEANVDKRNRDRDEKFKYTRVRASSMQSRRARKIHISPTGRISYEQRRSGRRRQQE